MLNDPGPGSLPVGVIYRRIALEIGDLQKLCFKTHTAVLQRAVTVPKVGIHRAGIDHLPGKTLQGGSVFQEVHPQPNLDSLQHSCHHGGVALHGNALIFGIEIVVIKGIAHRQAADNECRQILAVPAPLLFGVALHQLFVDIRAHQRNGLLLQILRLGDPSRLALVFNDLLGLLRGHNPPHTIEGIHIKGQRIKLPFVVCHGRIGKAVEFGEAIHIVPNPIVIGVEDMGAVFVHLNALHLFAVDISGNVIPLVHHKNGKALVGCLAGKHGTKQSCTDYQIIIHGFFSFPK